MTADERKQKILSLNTQNQQLEHQVKDIEVVITYLEHKIDEANKLRLSLITESQVVKNQLSDLVVDELMGRH